MFLELIFILASILVPPGLLCLFSMGQIRRERYETIRRMRRRRDNQEWHRRHRARMRRFGLEPCRN